MITRLHLETLAAQVQRQYGDEVLRQYLRILAGAPNELFRALPVEPQAQRAVLLLKAYQGSKPHAQQDVSVDLVDVSADGVLLAVADLRDGAVVIVPMPWQVARTLALQMLTRIHQVSDEPEEEAQIGEVKQSVN
jgi:hypothetical protein